MPTRRHIRSVATANPTTPESPSWLSSGKNKALVGVATALLLAGAAVGVSLVNGSNDPGGGKPSASRSVNVPRVVNGVEITPDTPLDQIPMISLFSKDGTSVPTLKESGLTKEQYSIAVAIDPAASPQTLETIGTSAVGGKADIAALFSHKSTQEGLVRKLLVDNNRDKSVKSI